MLRPVLAIVTVVAACVTVGVVGQNEEAQSPQVQVGMPLSPEYEPVTASSDVVMEFSRIKVGTVAAPAPEVEEAIAKPAPAPVGGMERISQIMAQYGVYAHPATRFHIGTLPADCMPAHACVVQDGVGKIDFYMLPDQITPYLVIHEIAHTKGILDECAADNFTAQYVGHRGHYC